MSDLKRFGVSMDRELLDILDRLVDVRGYANRSEAIRDLIRREHVADVWDRGNEPVVGTLTLVYDHHVGEIGDRLVEMQHARGDLVHSTMHVHLTHRSCLEVIVLKGPADEVRHLADQLVAARGVKHGQLVATTSEDLA